jgi:hypothetical protein
VCRQIGISDATFYAWKKKDAGLGVSELRMLKMLEDENARRTGCTASKGSAADEGQAAQTHRAARAKVVPATAANQHRSMDLLHDQMHDGRKFRILTVIDQCSWERRVNGANVRLTGRCVGVALDHAARQRGWPRAITVDTDNAFNSKALDDGHTDVASGPTTRGRASPAANL